MNNSKAIKEKVISRLIKWGWNKETVNDMVNEHFEYASRYYKTPSQIAKAITYL